MILMTTLACLLLKISFRTNTCTIVNKVYINAIKLYLLLFALVNYKIIYKLPRSAWSSSIASNNDFHYLKKKKIKLKSRNFMNFIQKLKNNSFFSKEKNNN